MAQLNKTDFKAKWATLFADNVSGDIGANDMRDLKEDISDSFLSIDDNFIDEDDMASDSATKAPSQQSVKAYALTGSSGATDNAIIRANGAGGKTVQSSTPTINDDGRIQSVTDPTDDQDAATKKYVDDNSSSITHTEGTYTPTLTGVANVASSVAYVCQYVRIGARVFVFGRIGVQATASTTNTAITLSLPIASNFSSDIQLAGVASQSDANRDMSGAIRSDPTSDVAELLFRSESTSMRSFYFQFMYQVL
ncbi:MAG TPA: hypothetical protein VD927_06610 [Chryseosolibacter sp.]|nr:hypothetical protein [Chryseosolibacter sp.]